MTDANSEQHQELFANPRESLGVELKQWIDPATNDGKAKIAKACIALRNNNGGILVVGIRNDGKFDVGNEPSDVRAAFHVDVVQAIVAKYASDSFEVAIDFVKHDGIEYPVIRVPPGVRTPVACRADLPGDGTLLRTDTVYVRTLQSNNTVSSSAARCKDWGRITQNCFDNREADIGAFIRRHLSGLDLSHLGNMIGAGSLRPPAKTPQQQAVELLNDGHAKFLVAAAGRNFQIPDRLGTSEVAVVVDGEFTPPVPSQNLLWTLDSSMPRHTGWPPWVTLSGGARDSMQPYVLDDGWEAFIDSTGSGPAHLDFWRIEPKGRFYLLRGLEDDMQNGSQGPRPYTTLDFLLPISRTAEIISVALSIARVLGCSSESTSLAFAFRWKNLGGRELTSWVEPRRFLRQSGRARQNEITSTITVPMETAPTALAPFVERAVQPLFALFDGRQFEFKVVEGIVRETVERRM